MPKTSNEKKGTNLLINKENSSDKELTSEDKYDGQEDNIINQETHQDKNSTAPDDDKTWDDESYEEVDIFSKDDNEGFAFIQDVTCNMNDKAGTPEKGRDTRQLDPARNPINCGLIYEQETAQKYP